MSCNNQPTENTINKNPADTLHTLSADKHLKDIPKPKEILISFTCLKNCEGDCNTEQKSNGQKPFDIKKSQNGDTLNIIFHFISDGCQQFEKVVEVRKDTVYLDYKPKNETICECYSDYKYQFLLTNIKNEIIFLKSKRI